MRQKNKEIIIDTSSAAAKYVTDIKGWVDSNGRYWGDGKTGERAARYSGCTHRECECGEIMDKMYTKCESCRARHARERYDARPKKEWDGITPLCDYDSGKFFFHDYDLHDYIHDCLADDEEFSIEDLQLVICDPRRLREVNSDYWEDVLPEDCEDLPHEVEEALEKLNKAIAKAPVISWTPGKFAAIVNLDNSE